VKIIPVGTDTAAGAWRGLRHELGQVRISRIARPAIAGAVRQARDRTLRDFYCSKVRRQ
jgi:hypothetical protein